MKDKIKVICWIVIFISILVIVSILVGRFSTNNSSSNNAGTEQTYGTGNIAIEVDSSNFESEVINSDKKVLIDFYATWCGPCKTLSPVLEDVARENEDIKLVKIDVDQNNELAYEYGITAMPTLVVIENGQEINRSVGAISKDMVLDLLEK